ncbi:MAG: hypothetical protein A2W22_00750 [Candidatus Levybacteria bacterium RBG_16_35_11]|nr:MAG: hypothetical protein A2W22_00750 [Candidatus Levybacteria bacterium RBG_16_35_11]
MDFKKTDNLKIETIVKFDEKKKKNHLFLKTIGFLLLLALLPMILTFPSIFVGAYALDASRGALKEGNLKQAVNYSSFAQKQFKQAEFFSKPLLIELAALGFSTQTQFIAGNIEFGKTIAKMETDILQMLILIKSEDLNNTNKLSSLINDAKNSLEEYNKQSALHGNNFTNETKYKGILSFASATINVWDDLLGLNGKRKYLVLFQNNMELRPGGGFIGSYGILTLDRGKVEEFKIHDVYDADGQLKGHIEPPFAIRRYLSKVHWYLRDSNFDISFPKGAASSAYFLNLETGEKVNGVIAVDVTFIRNLIEAIGPISVNDYNETVNADNIFYLTETHAEKDFFPGSTQKKDFLRSLFNAIQFKIAKDKKVSYLSLLTSLEKSLAEKHLLFAFDDQSIQSTFSVNNWSSSIPSLISKNGDIIDFLGINEANLGANKSNYFINRSVSKTASIDEAGKVNSTLTIDYKNTSDGKWPGGDYKNYLRIIVPNGAEISSIEIDGKKQDLTPAITNFLQYESKTFKPPTGLEIEKYSQDGKTVYGFLTIIPAGKIKTIKINYSILEKISSSKAENYYSFYFYKQPGTNNFPVNLSLRLANNFKFIDVPKEFNKRNNQITASFDAIGDINQKTTITRN